MAQRIITAGLALLLLMAGCAPGQEAAPTAPITPRIITATFLPPTPTPTASTTPIYVVITNTPTPTGTTAVFVQPADAVQPSPTTYATLASAPVLTPTRPSLESGVPGDSGAYSCAGAPAPRLTVGGTGRVTPGLPNKLRAQPSLSGTEIGSIPGGASFTVVDGPNCADGYTWWQVNYLGTIGWTASGNASEYWVEPQ
jgi:hypothetical protein